VVVQETEEKEKKKKKKKKSKRESFVASDTSPLQTTPGAQETPAALAAADDQVADTRETPQHIYFHSESESEHEEGDEEEDDDGDDDDQDDDGHDQDDDDDDQDDDDEPKGATGTTPKVTLLDSRCCFSACFSFMTYLFLVLSASRQRTKGGQNTTEGSED